VGSCGVQLQPLVDAMRAELLQQPVLRADETPVAYAYATLPCAYVQLAAS
jgi:hypothetical protein